ncbi:hypothetical protein U9M48_039300 [Paspalum notatum var. saurae]|uniref:Uncharacterized protein n=1 Tax=Paspalum notatum var. saurae TaxID=547442 RepID=A0AAQ3XEH2_PASNO
MRSSLPSTYLTFIGVDKSRGALILVVEEEQEPVAASTTLPGCRSSQVARPHHRRIGSIAKPIRAILRETSAAAA